jgi:Tol biopolymer transport system component/DNA-binding winged helix-turn-helix (wHTH) protein
MTDTPISTTRPRGLPRDLEGLLRREGFTLGEWRVEPRLNRIVADDRERSLDPRQMDVLVALALQPGDVLTRDELLARIWGDTFVTENTLSQAVSRLRKTLGDDRREPRYIATISRSGYRLVAPVELDPLVEQLRAVEDVEAPPDRTPWIKIGAGVVALAAVAALAWIAVDAVREQPVVEIPTVRPESTLPGNQFEPRLSPDGAYVAFAWQESEQSDWDIWIQRAGEDGPQRLTEHADHERLATWSPDGASLAFVRFSEQEQRCGIYRMSIVGGTAERLADCQRGMRTLDWSSDGRRFVMNGMEWDVEPGVLTTGLYLHDLETGERRRLTDPQHGTAGDSEPRFSPDGSWIAFRRKRSASRHDVMVVPADASSEPRALTADRWGHLRGVEWSADGRSVIYSSNRNGQFRLWRVGLDGGEPQWVPVRDDWVTQPSVARDGGTMIYRTFRDSVDLWELPLDADGLSAGEPIRRVGSSRSERHPAWSPVSQAVAFVSDRSGTHELWSGHADGTDLLRHTDFAGPQPMAPSWSPDGNTIVFDAATEGHSDLWRVGRDSRRPERLTSAVSEDRNAVFSRDGESIFFASDRSGTWEIWRMPAAGGEAVRLTTDGGFRAQPSPDGTVLYFVKLDTPGVWRMPVEGGAAELVLPGGTLSDWGSWVVGERGIYHVARSPTRIVFSPFGEEESITVHAPDKQIPYLGRALSLSADGRALLFSLIDHSDDEIMAVEGARF